MKFNQPYLKLKDYFLSKEGFEIRKDSKSGILKTFPTPDDLEKYYESEDYLSHSNDNKSLFARCYAFAKAINIKSKSKLIEKYAGKNPVLDIGAGIGDLVKTLNGYGLKASGFEPSAKARAEALKQKIVLKETLENELPHSYSVISMYHVLEHVPDIKAQKTEIEKLLNQNGVLILALPNYKSWDAQFFGKFWAAYDVPRHLYHFDRNAVKYFFNSGFDLIETKPMWFDSLYVSILSARYRKLPIPFLSGLILGFWSNMNALFTKEYSSVTYILKKRN
ncbi:MAG: class I SAM-dependent methyltransferase [Nonlabens sp.]